MILCSETEKPHILKWIVVLTIQIFFPFDIKNRGKFEITKNHRIKSLRDDF